MRLAEVLYVHNSRHMVVGPMAMECLFPQQSRGRGKHVLPEVGAKRAVVPASEEMERVRAPAGSNAALCVAHVANGARVSPPCPD